MSAAGLVFLCRYCSVPVNTVWAYTVELYEAVFSASQTRADAGEPGQSGQVVFVSDEPTLRPSSMRDDSDNVTFSPVTSVSEQIK
jgi:hypothetical protein